MRRAWEGQAGLLLVAFLLAELSCSGAGGAAAASFSRVSDSLGLVGRGVQQQFIRRRIISLLPSATDFIVALGSADRLVGRTDYDTDSALAHLPSVGQGLTPNVEWLIALHPDLVIGWPGEASSAGMQQVRERGIRVYPLRSETIAEIAHTARELGGLLGRPAAAESLVSAIGCELRDVRHAVAGRRRPTVLYVVWHDPLMTVGPRTFISEVITAAGGRNVFADSPISWPQVSAEVVVQRQPDVVIVPRGERGLQLSWLRTAPWWNLLQAVQTGRVFEVDANLFNRPGPDVAKAARRLARALHPDAFTKSSAPASRGARSPCPATTPDSMGREERRR